MKVHGASFSIDMNGLKAKQAKDNAETAKTFSKGIQKNLDNTLFRPLERVFYGYQPSAPEAQQGDISWLFNDNNITQGTAYQFDGYQWKPVQDSNKQIFGSQIFGADIHGASITGGTFSSESRGANGKSNFFVNTHGQIYARNYYMDIESPNNGASSFNHRSYHGDYSPNGNDRMGFNIDNGILQMHALANQSSGNTAPGVPYDSIGTTYLEPDYLKLRNSNDQQGTNIYARTDIRSGIISLGGSDNWSERLGTKITHQDLTISDGVSTNRMTGQNLIISNGMYTNTLTSEGMLTGKLNIGLTSSGNYAAIGTIDNSSLQFTNPRTGYPTDINAGHVYSHVGFQTSGQSNLGSISGSFASISHITTSYISAGNLGKYSDLSLKKNIQDIDKNEILSKINSTDIKSFQYKSQNNNDKTSIGPIIDDENREQKYYVPNELINFDKNNNDAIAIDNAIAFSFAGIQQLSKEKNDLELRVAKLERKLNNQ